MDNTKLKSIRNSECLELVTDVKQICQPLKDKGIVFFAKVRIYNNKDFVAITNGGEWLEHFFEYFNKGKYVLLNYDEINAHSDMNYFVVDNNNKKNPIVPKQQAKVAREIFHYGHGISIASRHEQYIDIYDFIGDTKNPQILNFIFNNVPYLTTFIDDFNKNDFSLLKKDIAYPKETLFENTSKKVSLKNNIALEIADEKVNQHFTPCESLVFKQLMKGQSAKQIADILDISPRTVEQHTNHIKYKLGCHYKNEIICFALRNGLISLKSV
ncbi:MAG: LuxR C-terminal-related transcriptional regulator [Gammaproteobacteria bacterium]|nr:LuxR C-terminal-related transcriptional regulator [Gammaproteobacteria bacterium]